MTDPTLDISTRVHGASARLILRGEVDGDVVPQLGEAVERLLAQGARELLVDLREVEYVDSQGLHALSELDARARRDGHEVRFVRATGHAWRAIEIVGLAAQLAWVDAPEAPGS